MADYDHQPGFFISPAVAQAYQRDIEEQIGTFSAYQTVLELGSGSGAFSEFLVHQGLNLLGIDRNPDQLVMARERLPHAQFMQADFANDKLPVAQRFDLIASRYVIHELPDPIATFQAWRPRLNPSGKLLIVENAWQRQDWGWSEWGQRSNQLPLSCTQTWATAAYCLQKAGFTVTHCAWMHHTNQLPETRLVENFRLYIIVAELPPLPSSSVE